MPESFKKVRINKLRSPVLVTGAAGFIGRRLVNRLLSDGAEVVALDIVACPEALEANPSLRWLKGDVTRRHEMFAAVSGVRTIFHLAAMVGDWGSADLHQKVTVEGTGHIFEAALASVSNPTVVLASSIVVYGQRIGESVCHEGLLPGNTFGPYSESKQAQERLAHTYLQKGLDIRIVRPANVYGAGSKPWVEELCKELKRGVPALIGGGEFEAGLVHVENVIEIFVRAARGAGLAGQIFNAADEEGITWKQYMTDLAELCGAPNPRSLPSALASSMAIACEKGFRLLRIETRPPITREALNLVGSAHQISMTKTNAVLGYESLVSYREGLTELRQYLCPSDE